MQSILNLKECQPFVFAESPSCIVTVTPYNDYFRVESASVASHTNPQRAIAQMMDNAAKIGVRNNITFDIYGDDVVCTYKDFALKDMNSSGEDGLYDILNKCIATIRFILSKNVKEDTMNGVK